MYFYEVFVSSGKYHGNGPLTYSSEKLMEPGTLVIAYMGNTKVVGFVGSKMPAPEFSVKPIAELIPIKPLPEAVLKLNKWMRSYYPGPLGILTQLVLPASLLTKGREEQPEQQKSVSKLKLPEMTADQRHAVNIILSGESNSYLLHGETGAGKTRVYIELAKRAIQNGKSSIILTPEIGLTPQLASAFEEEFPGKVIVTHSTQTVAQRRKIWLRIHRSPEPVIIIGPRSALFLPIETLGLIVVDEAHDTAYKQEQSPYYQATRVAAKLASLHNAYVVLGTSTPSIQDYFTFKSKHLPIVRMEKPAIRHNAETDVHVVDMTKRDAFSRSTWLSERLIEAIEKALSNHGQSLLFLNRRGTARLVLCSTCGWQSLCPHCDLPLTYHGDTHNLRCHTCGFVSHAPSSCPKCQSTDIQFKNVGTKTIAAEVNRLFPSANIQRFDTDTHKSDGLEAKYASLNEGKVDILVGTQLITKGLDLPGLALVGVINADTSLAFPDYTAEEKTFQMLRQVIGRVGRGHRDGSVVVQTYHPNRASIVAALNRDYEMFYEGELAERELFHFPPFYHALKVSFERASRESAMKTAQQTLASLLQAGIRAEVIGPAPAFSEKSKRGFRWQIILKSKQRTELTKVIGLLPSNCTYDIDPSDLL